MEKLLSCSLLSKKEKKEENCCHAVMATTYAVADAVSAATRAESHLSACH
jgi:hypothetical protein